MNTLTETQQQVWDTLTQAPIPFTTEQMSEELYRYLCDAQAGEHAYGEDSKGNSMEITWSPAHEEWQIINRFADGTTDIYYDGFHEHSWKHEEPELLYDILDRLYLVEDLQERLEEEAAE